LFFFFKTWPKGWKVDALTPFLVVFFTFIEKHHCYYAVNVIIKPKKPKRRLQAFAGVCRRLQAFEKVESFLGAPDFIKKLITLLGGP